MPLAQLTQVSDATSVSSGTGPPQGHHRPPQARASIFNPKRPPMPPPSKQLQEGSRQAFNPWAITGLPQTAAGPPLDCCRPPQAWNLAAQDALHSRYSSGSLAARVASPSPSSPAPSIHGGHHQDPKGSRRPPWATK